MLPEKREGVRKEEKKGGKGEKKRSWCTFQVPFSGVLD